MKIRSPYSQHLATAVFAIAATCGLAAQVQSSPASQSTQTQTEATKTTTALPAVQIIQAPAPDKSVLSGRKSSYSFTVSSSDWIDTKLTLTAGDHVVITASGEVKLSDGRSSTAVGLSRGWKDLIRQLPDPSSDTAALVGRIGEKGIAVPFLVGTSKTLDISQTGNLFLALNIGDGMMGSKDNLTSTGSYKVTLKLSQPQAAKATVSGNEAAAVPNLQTLLTPAFFDDIPRRVQDIDHNLGDMVNYCLVGTEDQVKSSFTAAGWVAVDKTTGEAVLHGLLATLSHDSYTEMPMSTLYLFGRPQDMSYARGDPLAVAAIRHHLRVWKTEKTLDGKPVWVGSSTHDDGFEKDQRNGGVTHHIDPDIDQERDFIQKSFAAAGKVAGAAYVLPNNPMNSQVKTATGGAFHSDGRIVVLVLQ